MSSEMESGDGAQLTRKQLKALQFRKKIEKNQKTADYKSPSQRKAEERAEEKRIQREQEIKKEKEKQANQPKKPEFQRKTTSAGNAVRFIAFVGNLPYQATVEDIQRFMKAANPTSVRLSTHKDTGKSRGFAFVEFGSSSDLKTALKFHHCRMNDKKVNVELTVGGGGNSAGRTEKIKRRREELDDERKRRAVAKHQKTEGDDQGEKGDGDNGGADSSSAPQDSGSLASTPYSFSKSRSGGYGNDTATATATDGQGGHSERDDGQGIDSYDAGDGKGKDKKASRRKRGRGSRK